MPWVRIDDGVYDHPKFLGLTFEASGVWLHTLAWSARQLTDGQLPRLAVQRLLAGDKRLTKIAAELVTAGLWDETPDGWEIHDFHDYQPTAAGVEEERRKARERQAKHRTTKGRFGRESRRDTAVTNGEVTADVTGKSRGSHVHPDPTRPETPPTPHDSPPVTAPRPGADGAAPGEGKDQNHHRLVDAAMAAAAAHELAQNDEPVRSPDRWTQAKLKQYEPRRARALELAQAGAQLEGLGDFFITGQTPTIRKSPPPVEDWTDQQRADALAQSADTRAGIRQMLANRHTTQEAPPLPHLSDMPERSDLSEVDR